jgi:hypothetical protein
MEARCASKEITLLLFASSHPVEVAGGESVLLPR